MGPDLSLAQVGYNESRPELMRFRNANRPAARDERYFDWRYLRRPGGREPIIVVARDAAGQVIGALSIVPHRYCVDDELAHMGMVGDISVDERWRGRNIGQALARYAASLDAFRSLWGVVVLPNEPAARMLEKAGWRDISIIHRYVRITALEAALRQRGCPAALARAAAAVATPLHERRYAVEAPAALVGSEATITEDVDERFDELWAQLDKRGRAIACRDLAHLRWRYVEHPVHRYRFFVLERAGKMHGYVVFHREGTNCFIEDWLCLESEHAAYLLARFVAEQKRAGEVERISLRTNVDAPIAASLRRAGFSCRQDFQRVMLNDGHLGNSGFARQGHGLRWFMTGGDKDV